MSDDAEDKSQKTELPSEQRLTQAREKGQIAVSREVSHWIVLFSIACLFAWVLPTSFHSLSRYLALILENADYFPGNGIELTDFSKSFWSQILKFCAIPFAVLYVAGIASNGIQTGFNISTESMKPKFDKISIRKGLERLFGVKSLVDFIKNLLKLSMLAGIVIMAFWPERTRISHYAELNPLGFLTVLERLSTKFFIWILSILGVLAILDYLYQKFMWLQNLKMTPHEVKQERKEQEGDPHIKGRLRQLRQERARRRAVAEVPNATVLITNPTHYAIALKYEAGETGAPVVLTKGADFLALKMREVAKEHDVPIVESPPLAQALYRDVKEGKEIPFEHYEAVAKIIRYILSRNRS